MVTNYQRMVLNDLKGANSYGRPLVGWQGQTEWFRDPGSDARLGALTPSLAATFVEQVYFLLSIQRIVHVYRGFETSKLRAPYGVDHPSFIQGLVQSRNPGTPDGLWWTPARPSKSIDNLRLSDMHRKEDRDNSAVTLQWNRVDFYLEAELHPGALVYAGRAAPQQESALFGSGKYAGGAVQFRLTLEPQQVLRSMKKYTAQ